MSKIYDIDYFIAKFSAIPDELWCIGEFTNTHNPEQHCAYGHCGCTPNNEDNEESDALARLFRDHDLNVASVNDADGSRLAGDFRNIPTPKARILAALESFK